MTAVGTPVGVRGAFEVEELKALFAPHKLIVGLPRLTTLVADAAETAEKTVFFLRVGRESCPFMWLETASVEPASLTPLAQKPVRLA